MNLGWTALRRIGGGEELWPALNAAESTQRDLDLAQHLQPLYELEDVGDASIPNYEIKTHRGVSG